MAKWLIAIVVAVGLCLAARTALRQWSAETARLHTQLDLLRGQLDVSQEALTRAELERSIAELESSLPAMANLAWDRIALASLLYALGLIPPSLLLYQSLRSLGQHPRVGTAIAAQLVGHLGKYVPGKAMVIVLRAGALSRDGVRPLPATISVFLETFLMMAVGAAVAALVVLWLPVPKWVTAASIVVAIAASLPTLPPILRRLAERVSGRSVVESELRIGIGLFAAGWGSSLLSWLLIGASFTALISAIPSSTPLPALSQLYPTATAAISLAMVIGFASLLPGGAGVRELVLTIVLGVLLGSVHGMLAAIAARILFIAVEAILAATAWLWLQHAASRT